MMLALRKWVIAELKASGLPGNPPVFAAKITELPSVAGVFVAMGNERVADRQHSEAQEIRITCIANGEVATMNLSNAVRQRLFYVPGQFKAWNAHPEQFGLRVRDIKFITGTPTEPFESPTGNHSTTTLVYVVRGSDIASS